MNSEKIEEKLLNERFSKRKPALSYSVDWENGWYEIRKPIENLEENRMMDSAEIGVAVDDNCNIEVYAVQYCEIGCCPVLEYSGEFDLDKIKSIIEKYTKNGNVKR